MLNSVKEHRTRENLAKRSAPNSRAIESLEARQLLSVTTVEFQQLRWLQIDGTNGDDNIVVTPNQDRTKARFTLNGEDLGTFDMTEDKAISIVGLKGDDNVLVNEGADEVLIQGGSGNDTLTGSGE